MGQFVSVVSCPFAANFQSTWLYVLCTFSSFFLILLFPSEQTQLSRCSWSAMHSTPLPVDCHWTHSNVFMSLLNWGGHNWTKHSRCVSPGLKRRECHLPQSTSCTFDSTAQDVVCFLCYQDTLLTHTQLAIHWDTYAFSSKATLQPVTH